MSRRSSIAYASGAFGGGNATAGAGQTDNAFSTSLATVTRRSLTSQTQVSATLGYAAATSVVVPAGTTPQVLAQATQAATTAQTQLQTAKAALSADTAALNQADASLSADRAKLTIDCGGDNAGESAASPSAGGSGGAGAGPCATDSQAVSTDEQSGTQAAAKVASDRQAVSSATTGLASAQAVGHVGRAMPLSNRTLDGVATGAGPIHILAHERVAADLFVRQFFGGCTGRTLGILASPPYFATVAGVLAAGTLILLSFDTRFAR